MALMEAWILPNCEPGSTPNRRRRRRSVGTALPRGTSRPDPWGVSVFSESGGGHVATSKRAARWWAQLLVANSRKRPTEARMPILSCKKCRDRCLLSASRQLPKSSPGSPDIARTDGELAIDDCPVRCFLTERQQRCPSGLSWGDGGVKSVPAYPLTRHHRKGIRPP